MTAADSEGIFFCWLFFNNPQPNFHSGDTSNKYSGDTCLGPELGRPLHRDSTVYSSEFARTCSSNHKDCSKRQSSNGGVDTKVCLSKLSNEGT